MSPSDRATARPINEVVDDLGAQMIANADALTLGHATQAFLRRPRSAALPIAAFGGQITILVDGSETDGRLALIEVRGRFGTEAPVHTHTREDETLQVMEGEAIVRRGADSVEIKAGETLVLPRGLEHGFRVVSPTWRALMLVSPAGFEEYLREIAAQGRTRRGRGHDEAELALRAAERYGLRLARPRRAAPGRTPAA